MQDKEHEDPLERFNRLLKADDETQVDVPAKKGTQPSNASKENAEEVPGSTPTIPPGVTPANRYGAGSRPALDENNMPLPKRVDEIDMNATRVSPAAFQTPSKPTPTQSTPNGRPKLPRKTPVRSFKHWRDK